MNLQDITRILDQNDCKLRGCSNKEILEIESFYEIKLPTIYVDFLRRMGKGAGKFLGGSAVFYDEIFNLRESSIRLLEENDFKPLPGNTFVFWMHQGYQFAFFYLEDSNNPEVYLYYEGRTLYEFERTEDSFTGFLEKQLIMENLLPSYL